MRSELVKVRTSYAWTKAPAYVLTAFERFEEWIHDQEEQDW